MTDLGSQGLLTILCSTAIACVQATSGSSACPHIGMYICEAAKWHIIY
jgi:hypothetical protein